MANSSNSVGSLNICDCGKRARILTSWSLKNPGRRFYTCNAQSEVRCGYFQWYDEEVEGRNGDVITHLNNRRIYLEAKIELLEEKINVLEGKLVKKKAKNKNLEKTVKAFKYVTCVIVVLFAMLVMVFQKKGGSYGWLQLM